MLMIAYGNFYSATLCKRKNVCHREWNFIPSIWHIVLDCSSVFFFADFEHVNAEWNTLLPYATFISAF